MTTQVTGWYDVTRSGIQTDYTGAITSCLTDITTAQGGVLYFPPGNYPFTGSFTLPAKTTVLGCGIGTTTLVSSNSSGDIFTTPTGQAKIEITGLTLSYKPGTGPSGNSAIVINSSKDVHITDVEIDNPYGGIEINGDFTAGTACNGIKCDRLTISTNSASDWGVIVRGGPQGGNQELHFTDCTLTGSGSAATGWLFGNISGLFMTSCSTTGFNTGLLIWANAKNGSAAIDYDAAYNLQIENCTFDSNLTNCQFATTYADNLIYTCTFTGCSFSDSSGGAGLTSAPVANGSTFSGIGISGCNISGNYDYGIILQNGAQIQISGCGIFANNKGAIGSGGVSVSGCTDVVVSGCTITGSGGKYGGNSQANGVVVASSTDVLLQGCDLTGNTGAPFTIDAASVPTSEIANNLMPLSFSGFVSVATHAGVPAIPNPYSQYATIYMSGVTSVTIAGTSVTGSPSVVRLGPGQSIVFHYTGTPTIKWFLD